MNICFAAAEVAPFAKTGGLADVSGALPAHLADRGHDVRVFMPLYSKIDTEAYDFTPVDFLTNVPVDLGTNRFHFTVFTTKLPKARPDGAEVDVYCINCPEVYHRPGIYTGEWDEHLRFALLAHATLSCCQRMGWSPDIVHCNDWHTALLPLYLKTLYSWDQGRFGATRTVLTIHNIAYQGWFPSDTLSNLGLQDYSHLLFQEDLAGGVVNFLKTGLLYADAITTVSRTYAREIQTEAFGNGLETILRERRGSLVGIVNGVDYEEWSPEKDQFIPQNYSIDDVEEGKAANQRQLLEELGLPYDPAAPLFGVVSRLTAQKGFDLLFEPMPEALRHLNIRFVVLGTGEGKYEEHFQWLQNTFPQKVCYYRGYNNRLAHWIEAASDVFVMPSRFEPCGLNQMYSLRYGTPPIVRKTGGLADTVEHFRPSTGRGTGFVFDHYDSAGFSWALRCALQVWQNQDAWAVLRRNGMEQDFSWQRQVVEYEKLYAAVQR